MTNFKINKSINHSFIFALEIIFYFILVFFIAASFGVFRSSFLDIPEDLRALTSFIILFFLPGRAITNFLFNQDDLNIENRVILWFCFSLFISGLIILGGYFFRFDIASALIVNLIIGLSLLIVDKFRDYRLWNIQLKKLKKCKNTNWQKILLWLIVFIFMLLAIKLGGFLESDARFHIANIRKLLSDNFINAFNSHLKNFGTYFSYAYSTWNSSLAMVSELGKVDPVIVWFRTTIFLAPLAILSIYSASSKIFKNSPIALISVLLVSVLFLIDIFHNLARLKTNISLMPFPLSISLYILIPTCLMLTFGFLERYKWQFLLALVFVSLVLIWVHIYYFLIFIAMLLAFFAGLLIFSYKDFKIQIKRLGLVLVSIIIITLPYLIFRYISIDQETVSSFGIRQFYLDHLINIKIGSIFHPKSFLMRTGESMASYLHIYAYIFLPFLIFQFKKKLWVVFSTSVMIGVLLIYFNPWVVNFLLNVLGDNKTWRIYQALFFPAVFVVSFMIYEVWLKIKPYIKKRTLFWFGAGLILIGGFYPQIKSTVAAVAKEPASQKLIYQKFDQETYSYIKEKIPARSQVLASPALSTFIPEYFNQYVFFGPALSGTKQVMIESEARKMIKDPSTNISLFQKYNPDFVIGSKNNDKYGNLSQFELLYENSKFKLYKYGD